MILPPELIYEILDLLPIEKYLESLKLGPLTGNPWVLAIKYNNLSLIKWLHRRDYGGCIKYVMNYAAKQGHLRILKYLHYNRVEGCNADAMDFAAFNGHIDILSFLNENRNEGCSYNALLFAIQNDRLDVVKWLVKNRPKDCLIKTAVLRANLNGQVEIEEYLKTCM